MSWRSASVRFFIRWGAPSQSAIPVVLSVLVFMALTMSPTVHPARPLAAGVRFVDVDGACFVVRSSCCLLHRTQGGELCTSCPRRPAGERATLLLRAAPGFR